MELKELLSQNEYSYSVDIINEAWYDKFKPLIASLLLSSTLYASTIHDAEDITKRIIRHEGIRDKVYKDTMGKTTIGIGFNLEAYEELAKKRLGQQKYEKVTRGEEQISKEDIDYFFRISFNNAEKTALQFLPRLKEYPKEVVEVVVEMAFQLGNRLHKFKNFKKELETFNYRGASDEMLDSLWALQTPNRAKELAHIIRNVKP